MNKLEYIITDLRAKLQAARDDVEHLQETVADLESQVDINHEVIDKLIERIDEYEEKNRLCDEELVDNYLLAEAEAEDYATLGNDVWCEDFTVEEQDNYVDFGKDVGRERLDFDEVHTASLYGIDFTVDLNKSREQAKRWEEVLNKDAKRRKELYGKITKDKKSDLDKLYDRYKQSPFAGE